jgi:hypothetical protein
MMIPRLLAASWYPSGARLAGAARYAGLVKFLQFPLRPLFPLWRKGLSERTGIFYHCH